jgi:large subunit ribosomal protein L18
MPDKVAKKKETRQRRHQHFLKHVRGTGERPRLVVFRSAQHIYAQIVDDQQQKTLFSVSTLTKDIQEKLGKAKGKIAQAKLVGMHLAEVAKGKNVIKIVFDRGGYLYHGRVKALADGAREGGLEF